MGEIVYPIECRWCHNTIWVSNPRQEYCCKNHRTYYHRALSRARKKLWHKWLTHKISPEVTWEDAESSMKPENVDYIAKGYGLEYSDRERKFVLRGARELKL